MQAQLEYETREYVICPECNSRIGYSGHLNIGAKTHWYCDNCGTGYDLQVIGTFVSNEEPKRRVLLWKSGKTLTHDYVLLKHKNLGLIIRNHVFSGKPNTDEENHYFYEQHTCPDNITDQIEDIFDLDTGAPDPHGIFEYVGRADDYDSALNLIDLYVKCNSVSNKQEEN